MKPRTAWRPDPRTQRLFEACLERGYHRLTGPTIERDWYGEQREFVICRSCKVPIPRKRATGWLGNIVDVKSRWHDGKPAKRRARAA